MSSVKSKSNVDVYLPGPSSPLDPCPGSIKINFDGALMIQLKFRSTAFVVKDSGGHFIGGGSASFPCCSSFSAEAIKLAIQFVGSLPPSSILIQIAK